jgi:hypothetical protein
MKIKLNAVVWDPQKGKAIARPTDGFFETDDETVIQRLKELGFIEENKRGLESIQEIPSEPIQVIEPKKKGRPKRVQ